jgi:hypothetical protein
MPEPEGNYDRVGSANQAQPVRLLGKEAMMSYPEPACLQAALQYLRLGWSVLPLCPHDHIGVRRANKKHSTECDPDSWGKIPWIRWAEFQERLPTEEEVREWFRLLPNSNLGCALGPVSKMVRIDVDGPAGEEKLQQMSGGVLPDTLAFVTGRLNGGRGLLYGIPPGVTLRTITKKEQQAMQELRFQARGSQTVLPPSRHKSGSLYSWVPGHSPDERELAPMPEWFIAAMTAQTKGKTLSARVPGEKVPKGGRKTEIDHQAGKLRAFCPDLSVDSIDAALQNHNAEVCDPPLAEHTVREVAEWVSEKPPGLPTPSRNGEADDQQTAFTPEPPSWPDPPAPEAYHGLAGRVVELIAPASEADPVALLVQCLVAFGSAAGRSAFFQAEGDRHFTNEFCVLVGRTSKGRKGTSWGRIRQLFSRTDEVWAKDHIASGTSSGEGLVWAVRDPITKQERVKERGQPVRYQETEVDHGVKDKRLLLYEAEFATVLKVMDRVGNTLSPVLRQAWDGLDLRTLVKNSPTRATESHIGLVGHVTVEELRRYLTLTEAANGWGNRHWWLCVDRSKVLPEGGHVDTAAADLLVKELQAALRFAYTAQEVKRNGEARELWCSVYEGLSAGKPGLAGSLLARGEAHVMRMAMLYALLDKSSVIGVTHLRAALALWRYCEQSVSHIFGDSLGDSLADELLRLLRGSPSGLTRNEIMNYFGRHQPSGRIDRALGLLLQNRLARFEKEETGGRHAERWFATSKA